MCIKSAQKTILQRNAQATSPADVHTEMNEALHPTVLIYFIYRVNSVCIRIAPSSHVYVDFGVNFAAQWFDQYIHFLQTNSTARTAVCAIGEVAVECQRSAQSTALDARAKGPPGEPFRSRFESRTARSTGVANWLLRNWSPPVGRNPSGAGRDVHFAATVFKFKVLVLETPLHDAPSVLSGHQISNLDSISFPMHRLTCLSRLDSSNMIARKLQGAIRRQKHWGKATQGKWLNSFKCTGK